MRAARVTSSLTVLLLLVALVALPASGCMETTIETAGDDTPDLQAELQQEIQQVKENTASLASAIHDLINQERRKAGLDPLQWDQGLANIALVHSTDMGTRDYFDHISPEGEDFADRYEEHGYHLNTTVGNTVYVGAENLSLINVVRSYTYDEETGEVFSYQYNDLRDLADSTVQGWMESPGHRDNILTPFTREGIGVFVTDEGEVYITENFS